MFGFLWEMRRYFRQVAGQLALGSAAGIIMNTAVVLPAILLGRAIDQALAWERGSATATDVGWAAHARGRWVARRTTRAREANADLTAAIQEYLAGVRVLRLFGRVAASGDRIAGLSTEVAARNLSLARLKGGLQPIYTTLMIAGVVLIVWKGSERVVAGIMTVGAFVAYLELFLRFVNRGHRIPQLVNSVQSGAAAYARLRPLLAPALGVAGEPRVASFRAGHIAGISRTPVRPTARTPGPVAVSLRGATFRYPGAEAPALRELNLDIPAGF